MPLTPNDPIQGVSQGELAQALAYAQLRGAQRYDFTVAYLTKLYQLCQLHGLRFEILVGQWADETGVGTSEYWIKYGNPAGIGALQAAPGGEVTYVGVTYVNGPEAAIGHIYHMLLYTKGEIPITLQPYKHLDPRADAVVAAGYLGIARSIKDLTGRWATNPQYAEQIVAHINRAFPTIGTTPTSTTLKFGRVPHPTFSDRQIPDSQNTAWNNLGQRRGNGVVLHRMVGNLWGTDGYFRTFANARSTGVGALTDYGIGVAASDGAVNDGLIIRWNHPLGVSQPGVSPNRAGWASGPYSAVGTFGDGKAFVQEFGVNAINRDQISIEISGDYGTPLSEKSRSAVAGLIAYWADQAKIPWDKFPDWPEHNYSFVRWHVEFCGEATKPCPGWVVRNETNALIERARQIMKRFQVVEETLPPPPLPPSPPPLPVYEDVSPIETLYPWDGRDRTVGSTKMHAIHREFIVKEVTPVYKYGDPQSAQVREPLQPGDKITVDYWFETSEDGSWLYTANHWRIPVKETNLDPVITFKL